MIVRPNLGYCAAFCLGTSHRKLQKLTCVCITGAMRTCPTAAMDLAPLHLVVKGAAKSVRGKCIGLQNYELLLELTPLSDASKDGVTRKYLEWKFLIEVSNKQE